MLYYLKCPHKNSVKATTIRHCQMVHFRATVGLLLPLIIFILGKWFNILKIISLALNRAVNGGAYAADHQVGFQGFGVLLARSLRDLD